MKQQRTALFLCSLFLVSVFASLPGAAAGPPAQIVISTPSTVISSDGVLQMEATLYDALNNVVEGEITWSTSNGTIEDSGLFFPWSAGQVTIRAEHAGFNDTVVVTVQAGFGQSIEINTTAQPRAKFPFTLQANLIDSHDNPRSGQDVVWTVDGMYVGQGEPSWTPPSLGLYEVVARYDQLEQQVTMEAIAGDPYEFAFPEDLVLRSGEGLQLYPDLLDS
ncbi:MAG: Ig-like domain-containing protein, partial [Candidatus Poseidoniaceae archaeon]